MSVHRTMRWLYRRLTGRTCAWCGERFTADDAAAYVPPLPSVSVCCWLCFDDYSVSTGREPA